GADPGKGGEDACGRGSFRNRSGPAETAEGPFSAGECGGLSRRADFTGTRSAALPGRWAIQQGNRRHAADQRENRGDTSCTAHEETRSPLDESAGALRDSPANHQCLTDGGVSDII